MAAELSTRLLHEFIAKAAKQIAREQAPAGVLDQQTLLSIRLAAESTVNGQAKILDKIKKVESGERYVLGLTDAETEIMQSAFVIYTGQTMFGPEVVPTTVTFQRDMINIYPPFTLDADRDFVKPIFTQMGSIIVESVALVLRLIGINLPVHNNRVRLAINNARTAVSSIMGMRKDVYQIVTDKDDGNAMGKDILMLVINMYADAHTRTLLWDIVKSFLVRVDVVEGGINLSEWYKIVGQISAFIGMMVATDGTAKIAKLAMELGDFAYLKTKLADLEHIKKIRAERAVARGEVPPVAP